jgi:hypothetical protein
VASGSAGPSSGNQTALPDEVGTEPTEVIDITADAEESDEEGTEAAETGQSAAKPRLAASAARRKDWLNKFKWLRQAPNDTPEGHMRGTCTVCTAAKEKNNWAKPQGAVIRSKAELTDHAGSDK